MARSPLTTSESSRWLGYEGLTLGFLGLLMSLVTFLIGPDQAATLLVARASSAMLFAMAGLSFFTGARTAVLPMKLCPFIKLGVGAIFLVATFL